jgi:hypothetical protein
MRIHVAGRAVEPISFLCVLVTMWCFVTIAAVVLMGWAVVLVCAAVVLVCAAVVDLPMALLRRMRA